MMYCQCVSRHSLIQTSQYCFPDISYSFYSVWADLYRIPYEKQPLDKDFNIIPEDYYKENGGVVFPNPNAPTALYMELDKVEDIIKHNQM